MCGSLGFHKDANRALALAIWRGLTPFDRLHSFRDPSLHAGVTLCWVWYLDCPQYSQGHKELLVKTLQITQNS